MKSSLLIVVGICLFLCACQNNSTEQKANQEEGVTEINFHTTDSIKIIGDLYESNKEEALILLFHQGGSNARAEYGSIIPKLTKMGFNILAIDQRLGGQIYGGYNRTLVNIKDNSFDNPYGYCDAFNNLEGALDYAIASGFSGKKILWGSSYSASLAIQLAHQRSDDVNGVLAFSPASPKSMEACRPSNFLETLKTPLLLLRPPNEMESEKVQAQFDLAKENNHQTYAAKYGKHGSSMLVEDRVKNNVEETWKVVNAFLEEVRKK